MKKGESGQFASKGNVCILPQEPKILMSVLPPPINVLCNEVAVIFVTSTENPVTAEILEKSPLLVHRHCIMHTLEWLKSNNPIYKDIIIDHETLNHDYPANGPALGFATTEILNNSSANSEGTTYANYVSESNDAACTDEEPFISMSPSGMLDTDQVTSTFKMHKLEALQLLKSGKSPFVKFGSGNQPLKTSWSPEVWCLLWLTLFPYGIGSFEDPVRRTPLLGVREIKLKAHVRHYLSLKDTHFQKHVCFPFVMMNVIQQRTTS